MNLRAYDDFCLSISRPKSNNSISSQKRLKTLLIDCILTRERTVAPMEMGNVKTDLTM